MITEAAQKAFDIPLKQFEIDESILVCLENIDCPTDTSTPFLASFLLDLDIDQADLGVNESADSIYQIDVNYASHLGSASINKMIDKLRAKFPIGSYHSFGGECFSVDELSVSSLRVDNGWSTKSISLTISAFTAMLTA